MQQLMMAGSGGAAQDQKHGQAPLLNSLRYDLTELAGVHKAWQ